MPETHLPVCSQVPERVGIIAGWGQLPVEVARQLKRNGKKVYCCGIRNHASPELADICDEFKWVGLARTRSHVRFFRRHQVHNATMAGKIFKTLLFKKFGWVRQFPDTLCLRYLGPHFVTKSKQQTDDSILLSGVRMYADNGVKLDPATEYAPQLLVKESVMTKKPPSKIELRDVQFGWKMAKEMGRLDVGQTVIVKSRAVLAVEAIEGTDECIRRAGNLCPAGGFTMVKVSKPQQDMRFDVPTIGIGTLKSLRDAGGNVLAIEAEKTIILDQSEFIKFAERFGIKVLAISSDSVDAVTMVEDQISKVAERSQSKIQRKIA